MRLSFAYFALALPLLAASQTNYLISSEQIGYNIYATDESDLDHPVNISEFHQDTVSLRTDI